MARTPPRKHAFDDPISPREAEVLDALALGLTNIAMAEQLGISDQTVKNHLRAAYTKLGTRNRTATALLWTQISALYPKRHAP